MNGRTGIFIAFIVDIGTTIGTFLDLWKPIVVAISLLATVILTVIIGVLNIHRIKNSVLDRHKKELEIEKLKIGIKNERKLSLTLEQTSERKNP